MKPQDYQISSEKFVFHSHGDTLHDKKLETKPIGYFKDALHRFTKNKGSIVAAFIILFLVLFALFGPIFTPYSVSYSDITYKNVLPKNEFFSKFGIWDGKTTKTINESSFNYYRAIEIELGTDVISDDYEKIVEIYMKKQKISYKAEIDTYTSIGAQFVQLTDAEYKALQEYQNKTLIQVILPITSRNLRPQGFASADTDANYWYLTKTGSGGKTDTVFDENGNYIPIYELTAENEVVDVDQYNSIRVEGNERIYNYAEKMQGLWNIRVNYEKYYTYYHQEVLKDKITKPVFVFGADGDGKDIFTCLTNGARFSFILAIIVASVNLFVGAIYGAIEGYYGGKVDLVMERICDLLGAIPFMIVITLLKYHLQVSHVVVLFISFFLTGWMGMAGSTRMQFYRFKNQEYVLVARTLGANDRRIMFKHIFPNAIGTLITRCVLVIPGVIFSETSLSYLGIIDLTNGGVTSVGTLLSKGQQSLYTFPHIIVWPALFISLLMLSFNLFGNGLRDAFNPSLRGTEE